MRKRAFNKKKTAGPDKPPLPNYYDKYWAFLVSKKFLAGSLLVLSAMGGMFKLLGVSPLELLSAKSGTAREMEEKIADVPATKTFRPDSLFSVPFFFYNNLSGVTEKEIVDNISLTNGEVSVAVSIDTPICRGNKYVMVNERFIGGEILHKVLPVERWLLDSLSPRKSIFDHSDDGDEDMSSRGMPEGCVLAGYEDNIDNHVRLKNPGFEIKINNNSADNIMLEDIQLEVSRSETNTFPVIIFTQGFSTDIPIFNFGFGKAIKPVMRFNIQKTEAPIDYRKPFKHKMRLPDIPPVDKSYYTWHSGFATLEKALDAEGMDGAWLRNVEPGVFEDVSADTVLGPKKLGRFVGDRDVRIVGALTYTGKLPDGSMREFTFHFNYIMDLSPPEFGGDSGEIYHSAYNIKLEADKKQYKKRINVNESVAPKSDSRFYLYLSSGTSAYHLFDIVIHYNGQKEMRLKNIFLNEWGVKPSVLNTWTTKKESLSRDE